MMKANTTLSGVNQTLYLKYRPQTLSELAGQEQVKNTLLSHFQNNKLSHAYILVGPRGTGKTSTARILAKMVNCESQESRVKSQDKTNSRLSTLATSDYPCNKCATCLSITDGSNLDLIEIDAASNRGIEDIRSLREKIKLAPTSGKKKVYIIDEVHMLTQEAFNALLKTLEEPPHHAMFILATTDVTKVPQTILSRAQKLDFKLANSQEILQVLQKIAKAEKIEAEEEALKSLAKKAEGSFRDGVKLLDQLSSLSGKITSQDLAENLKSTQFEDLKDLINSVSNHDAKKALLTLSKQTDIKDLALSLMDILRNLVFIKNGLGEELIKQNWTEEIYEKLLELAEDFTMADLAKNLNILQEALEKIKFASIPSLPLELAIVEICGTQKVTQVEKPRETLSNSPDIAKIKEKWTFVLETIRPYNFSLEALLRSTNIHECTPSEVIMEVPYSFHQRILEAPKNRDLLESVFSDVLGRQVKVSTILGTRPAKREDIANIEVAADDEIIRVAAEIFEGEPVN